MLKSLPVPAFFADQRSDQQKVDALLEQYASERDIELAHDPSSEIEARIASLRDAGVQPNTTAYLTQLHDIDSSDEETQIDKITRKIMDEVAIESSTTANNAVTQVPPKKKHPRILKAADRGTPLHASTPELSFCVICYVQATTRCLDCDGDLYCSKCFTEIHRDWSETHHKSIPYKPRTAATTSEEDEDMDEDED